MKPVLTVEDPGLLASMQQKQRPAMRCGLPTQKTTGPNLQHQTSPSTANDQPDCLQGIKTVVTVDDPGLVGKYAAEASASNEVWVDYTDDAPPLRAKHPGDPRAAFTPWLADKVRC